MAPPYAENPAEVAALKALKDKLARLRSADAEYGLAQNDHTLLRYLRGHKLRPDEALELIVKCGHWRKENGIDHLMQRIDGSGELVYRAAKAYLPMGVIGHDIFGRPVSFCGISMIDFPRVLGDFSLDIAVNFAVANNERLLDGNPSCEAIVILDIGALEGVTPPITSLMEVRPWISAFLTFLKPFASVSDPFYPEMFQKIFITRAPGLFQTVYKVASSFVAEATREKIVIYTESQNAQARKHMLDYMDDAVVPYFIGGKNDLRMVGQGGKLKKGEAGSEAFILTLEQRMKIKEARGPMAAPTPQAAALQRSAALDMLRNAIASKGRLLDAEAEKRGSWRFVPGLAWLESLDDDTLEAALAEHDYDPDMAIAQLSRLAIEHERIKLPASSLAINGASSTGSVKSADSKPEGKKGWLGGWLSS